MRTLTTIILLITLFSAYTQTPATEPAINNKNEVKREFTTQGEQEDYWAEQLFDKEYSKQHYDKFKGKIVINEGGYSYDDKTLVIYNMPEELKTIFSTGIFHSNIITGDRKTIVKSQAELDTLSPGQIFFYNLTRTDSFTISDFEELNFLSNSPKYKRFRFWLWDKAFANPTVCFIELTNKKATKKTDLPKFINGASLTFFKEGWMVI